MKLEEAQKLIQEKFTVPGKREGNAVVFDGVWRNTNKLVRVVLTLGDCGHVKQICIYPWHPDFAVPGTEKHLTYLLEQLL